MSSDCEGGGWAPKTNKHRKSHTIVVNHCTTTIQVNKPTNLATNYIYIYIYQNHSTAASLFLEWDGTKLLIKFTELISIIINFCFVLWIRSQSSIDYYTVKLPHHNSFSCRRRRNNNRFISTSSKSQRDISSIILFFLFDYCCHDKLIRTWRWRWSPKQ
jgi:hypothetical protein